MKKILIFSLAYYPHHVSGAEAAIKEITERIHDIEFHMVTLRFGKEDREEKLGNIYVHRVGSGSAYVSKILFPLLAALKARSLDQKLHFDAMWAMMTYMLLPVELAKTFGVRVPHVLTLQDGDPYEKVFGRVRVRPFLPLIDRGFRTADVIQVISSYLGTWPKLRGSEAPVELIRNGANPRDLHESVKPVVVEALKQKLGKKDGDIWLVNTARLEQQKAQDDVIRALLQLPENIKFLIVGGGSDEGMLKKLVQELHLENRVIFVGQVTRDEVTAYRKASDIFAAPSRSEGLGNAFLSAMASRLPVIATQEGGLADFVSEETAWVVPKDRPEAIAAAVKDILNNPEKVKKVADTARKMVEDEYDWDVISGEMSTRIFGRALGGSLVERARDLAISAHEGQVRKSDGSPYIEHPRAVAEILKKAGASETVVAAGWVHDVVEDTSVTLETIRHELGDKVHEIVKSVTEDKSLKWEERKRHYVDAVRRASADAKLVSLADKIHNAHAFIAAHAAQGTDIWKKFSRGKDKKQWFEDEMLSVFKDSLVHPLVSEYEELVEKLRRLD